MFPRRTSVSLTVYLAFAIALLLLGLLWLAQSSLVAHAQDQVAQHQPEALGNVSGVVRALSIEVDAGEVREGIDIWLDASPDLLLSMIGSGKATTK
jgi:hypothetical protein